MLQESPVGKMCIHFLVACTQLHLSRFVGWSIRLPNANYEELATYGNRPCSNQTPPTDQTEKGKSSKFAWVVPVSMHYESSKLFLIFLPVSRDMRLCKFYRFYGYPQSQIWELI